MTDPDLVAEGLAKMEVGEEEEVHISRNKESDEDGMVTLVVTIELELLRRIEKAMALKKKEEKEEKEKEEKERAVTEEETSSVQVHNSATTFSMVGQNLTVFPAKIEQVAATLRSINLSKNGIKKLQKISADFEELRILNLEKNEICHIDEAWGGRLAQLTHLKLNSNRITSIPRSFHSLIALREVHLASNQLSSFPVAFCHSGLTQLALLDLSNNLIAEIPLEIFSLQAMELNLNGNQISSIHRDISQCPKLQILRLKQNCLTLEALPTSILRDSKVSLLCLEGNYIDKKALVRLDEWETYMQRFTAVKKKTDFRSDA